MHNILAKFSVEMMVWEAQSYHNVSEREAEKMREIALLTSMPEAPQLAELFHLYVREAYAACSMSEREPASFDAFEKCFRSLPAGYVRAMRRGTELRRERLKTRRQPGLRRAA